MIYFTRFYQMKHALPDGVFRGGKNFKGIAREKPSVPFHCFFVKERKGSMAMYKDSSVLSLFLTALVSTWPARMTVSFIFECQHPGISLTVCLQAYRMQEAGTTIAGMMSLRWKRASRWNEMENLDSLPTTCSSKGLSNPFFTCYFHCFRRELFSLEVMCAYQKYSKM